jgi:V/A-type H+-transporting ATPase subunit C
MAYEYLNTRLRYLKSKLLRPEQFAVLLDLRDLEEFINALAETDYGPEIEASSVQFSGYPLVEDAIVRHTQRVFSRVYGMALDQAKTLIRILLERFEVFNLKTILRGFHIGAAPEVTAESLFPTILYPTAFYQDLLRREGIAAVVDYLLAVGNRFYKPLAAALPEYEASGKLALLESALDAYYFSSARKTLQEMANENAILVRRMLGTEADILNLVYALRIVEAGLESEEKVRYILPGGERLKEAFVRDLLNSPDKASFIRKLQGTYYQRALGEIDEGITASEFQERLENLLYAEQCKFDPGRVFDIHLAAAFIWRLSVEAINLRVIASGISRGAPREIIEDQLIWVEGMMPERTTTAAGGGSRT